MQQSNRVALSLTCALALWAGTEAARAADAAAPAADAAIHAQWLDRSADPLQDFFQFANGGFVRANPIPAAYPSWGQFEIVNQQNQDYIHELLQAAAADQSAAAGSERRKIGDFFASGMDEAAVEKAGAKPLAAHLARIAAL